MDDSGVREMARNGKIWQEMAIIGKKWQELARNGKKWQELARNGKRWQKMGPHSQAQIARCMCWFRKTLHSTLKYWHGLFYREKRGD